MGEPLIQLVQDVQTELGLPLTTSVIRSLDNSARQLGSLATRAGMLMIRAHDWTFLQQEWRISLAQAVNTTGDLTAGSAVIGNLGAGLLNQLVVGSMVVSGPGVPAFSRLIRVDLTALTATMDQPATQTQTAAAIAFVLDTYPQPDDYLRAINATHWDRSNHWGMSGPLSPQEDQWLRSGVVSSGPRIKYRAIGNAMRLWPVPQSNTAGSPLVSEYVSKNWVRSAAGVGQPRFLADQDTALFDNDLMIMGIKLLFFQTKGFSTDDLAEQWKLAVLNAIACDGPSRTLNMGVSNASPLISPAQVQDGNWPGPGN